MAEYCKDQDQGFWSAYQYARTAPVLPAGADRWFVILKSPFAENFWFYRELLKTQKNQELLIVPGSLERDAYKNGFPLGEWEKWCIAINNQGIIPTEAYAFLPNEEKQIFWSSM